MSTNAAQTNSMIRIPTSLFLAETSGQQAFGLRLHNNTLIGAAGELLDRAAAGKKTRVAFVNAHCINHMWRNPEYDRAVRTADYVLPDGSGIAIANVVFSGRKCANLNGTDLAPILFEQAAQRGLSVYFFGGLPGVARRMCQKLATRFPGLQIAGYRQGYFHTDEEKRIIREINDLQPDIILVAMGVPHQAVWLSRNHASLNAKLVLGVGGLFDFLSARLPRAPHFLRVTGMEWVFRLWQEPKRMWRRYVLGNPEFIARTLFIAHRQTPRDIARKMNAAAKRVLDIAGSAAAILCLSPIFILTAIAIRSESKGPILFKQKRVGKNGRHFTMLKFRSMATDAEALRCHVESENHHGAEAVTFKIANDPRVTKVGKLIRKYSIDELPQLLNVLKGDMALVGPRPALPREVALYTAKQRRRLEAKPGITCTWQISGRADIPFEKQVEMDVQYIKEETVFADIRILLATPMAVLTARGAY